MGAFILLIDAQRLKAVTNLRRRRPTVPQASRSRHLSRPEEKVPTALCLRRMVRFHSSGKPYDLITGGLDSIVTITPKERQDLLDIARSLEEVPPRAECQGRSNIRPPWRRNTRPSRSGSEFLNAAMRRRGQDAGAAGGWRAFLLCSRR